LAQAVTPEQQLLYYKEALRAIQHAATLAPTDAKIQYNLGVLYGQTGDLQKGIEILQQTIIMKPDYKDAYFALGLFYRQAAVDANNRVVNPELNAKAIATYEEIITKFGSDEATLQSIEEWKQ
jgi:tetratricopeptide (TPR) repeat protein